MMMVLVVDGDGVVLMVAGMKSVYNQLFKCL